MKNNIIKNFKENYQRKYDEKYNPIAVNAALRYSKKYGFDSGDNKTYNNEADAFKHTFASALVSMEEGQNIAFYGGWYHEMSNKANNFGELHMDTNNNKVGRNIANELIKDYAGRWDSLSQKEKEDIIAERVWRHMKAGDVILSPDGRRKLRGENRGVKVEGKTKKSGSNVSDKTSCVGSYPVSGYTRSDGTEVKGYTRHCGAKHSINSNSSHSENMFDSVKENVFNKYKNKKVQDMSKSEINEFLKAYFG